MSARSIVSILARAASPPLTLTDPHADAHPAPGDHAGDLQRAAALVAHQAVPGLQAARGAAAARALALRGLVALRLCLLGVLQVFTPLLALAFTHDASHRAGRTEASNLPNTPKRSVCPDFQAAALQRRIPPFTFNANLNISITSLNTLRQT